MDFYEKMHIEPLINASETYTNLGGSLMDERVFAAMREAGSHFVDMGELLDKVCARAAKLTKNEGAFITTGAAGGVILSAAACICKTDEKLLDQIPHLENVERKEILVFDGPFLNLIPYWKLIGLTGAVIRKVEPTAEAMLEAADDRTAAVFLFPATLYEKGIPTCEEVIPKLKEKGVTVVVDAAAQLPPPENLWYYTKKLGADLAVFSGGKHIRGPQSTGLIVGQKDLTAGCRLAASPNPRIGRAFKTGKEELAGFLTALELFIKEDPALRFEQQERMLLEIKEILENQGGLRTELIKEGRLGTYQPLLLANLPEGMTARECNEFTRSLKPAVDVGVYGPEFGMPKNRIFLNAYNLKEGEPRLVGEAVLRFVKENSAKPT